MSDSTNDEILVLSTAGEYLGTILGDHAGFRSPAGHACAMFVPCMCHICTVHVPYHIYICTMHVPYHI